MPLSTIDGLDVLTLRGSPSEMGAEHGRLLKPAIRTMVREYLHKSMEIFEVPYEFLSTEAQRCLPFIPESYVEEIAGAAEGSGESFNDLLALNCIADVDGCYTQNILQCCNFVVGPPQTKGELFLHGRNLDFPPAGDLLPRCSVVIARVPANGALPTLAFGWAGSIGLFTGCNAAQLTCAEVSTPAKDSTVEGMPMTFLLRNALELAHSVEEFTAVVRRTPRTCGFNLAVADGKNRSASAVEFTRGLCATRPSRKGALVVDNPCLCRETARFRLTHAAGAFRHARMTQLIQSHKGEIDESTALQFLQDRFDMAYGAARIAGSNCICNHQTVLSVLFFPAERRTLTSYQTVPAPHGIYRNLPWDLAWGKDVEDRGQRESRAQACAYATQPDFAGG